MTMHAIGTTTCDNEGGPDGATNTRRDLTHPSRVTDPEGSMKPSACTVQDCESKPFTSQGLCSKHYYRLRRHGSVDAILIGNSACTVEGCEGRKYQGRGLCTFHYGRAHRARRTLCAAPGCDKQSRMREHCWEHGERLKKYGRLERPPARERRVNSLGYVLVKDPDHPIAASDGWLFEHRKVLYAEIGPGWHSCHWCGVTVSWERTYPRDADALVVDHVDADRQNNLPSNLVPSCSPCNINRRVAV